MLVNVIEKTAEKNNHHVYIITNNELLCKRKLCSFRSFNFLTHLLPHFLCNIPKQSRTLFLQVLETAFPRISIDD